MIAGIILVAICIVGETARELCFKRAAQSGAPLATSPALWGGLLFWAAEVVLWIVTLRYLPIAMALPLMALSFATVPLAAQALLRERIRPDQLVGIALISAGAVCVGLSGVSS
jgi:undecaprenyl phosphate-alpha-L-ara4N flippase subunit ArnE